MSGGTFKALKVVPAPFHGRHGQYRYAVKFGKGMASRDKYRARNEA
jgi:hypothetical protein